MAPTAPTLTGQEYNRFAHRNRVKIHCQGIFLAGKKMGTGFWPVLADAKRQAAGLSPPLERKDLGRSAIESSHKGFEFTNRQRFAEIVALDEIAAFIAQQFQLLVGLHTFGDDRQFARACQR